MHKCTNEKRQTYASAVSGLFALSNGPSCGQLAARTVADGERGCPAIGSPGIGVVRVVRKTQMGVVRGFTPQLLKAPGGGATIRSDPPPTPSGLCYLPSGWL